MYLRTCFVINQCLSLLLQKCIRRWAHKRFNVKLRWFAQIVTKSPKTYKAQLAFHVSTDKMVTLQRANSWVNKNSFSDQPVPVCQRKKKIQTALTARRSEKSRWRGYWSGNSECCSRHWPVKAHSYLLLRPAAHKPTRFTFLQSLRWPFKAEITTSNMNSKNQITPFSEVALNHKQAQPTPANRPRMKVSQTIRKFTSVMALSCACDFFLLTVKHEFPIELKRIILAELNKLCHSRHFDRNFHSATSFQDENFLLNYEISFFLFPSLSTCVTLYSFPSCLSYFHSGCLVNYSFVSPPCIFNYSLVILAFFWKINQFVYPFYSSDNLSAFVHPLLNAKKSSPDLLFFSRLMETTQTTLKNMKE